MTDLNSDAYASRDLDSVDQIGVVHQLKPQVMARAERVVRRFHGDHDVDELLAMLGLTETTS